MTAAPSPYPEVSKSRRLILAGHSHLVAIAGPNVFTGPSGLVSGRRGDGTLVMGGPPDWAYWDALTEVAAGADVGVIWGGNEHNICFFFEAGPRFDFLSTHVPKMDPSAQILPKAAIRQRFQQSMTDLGVALERLAMAGANRVALIGTPPPKGDNEALRAFAQLEDFFVEAATSIGQAVETLPITDPHVRLKLWYLLQEMQAEQARARGAMYIPVPKEVQDAEGFLKREFWLADVTHANEAYGDLMYETVVRAFR
jgi:hypothetical protein